MFPFRCAICLNADERSKKEAHPVPMSTPCGHIYHQHCLLHWFETKRSEGDDDYDDELSLSCPVCNSAILEENCIRLFPEEEEEEVVRLADQGTQTAGPIPTPTCRADGARRNVLFLDSSDFQNFIRRLLSEKRTAQLELERSKLQIEKLQMSVVGLVLQNKEKSVNLKLADEFIAAQLIQAQQAFRRGLTQNPYRLKKKLEKKPAGYKKRSIWQNLFKIFVHPGYDG